LAQSIDLRDWAEQSQKVGRGLLWMTVVACGWHMVIDAVLPAAVVMAALASAMVFEEDCSMQQ